MDSKSAKISPLQLMFLITGFVLGSILLSTFIDAIAKQDAWLVIVSAFVASIPFILSYIYLAKRFPGKSIIEINDIVYGQYLGKAVSVLLIGYFFHLVTVNLRILEEFYAGFILPDMPMLPILSVFALICTYAVKKGIETIARLSLFSVVFSVFTVTVTFTLLLGNMDTSNFLPAFQVSTRELFQGTHIFSSISFCEIAVFLMVFPAVNKTESIEKYAMGGYAIAALILLVIAVRNTAVLGATTTLVANASYITAMLVDIGEVLTRIELLIAISITMAMFIKVSVLYYATATGIAQLFRVRSVSVLLIPLGIITVIFGFISFDSNVEDFFNAIHFHPFYTIPYEYVIPPLTLIVARIRKLGDAAPPVLKAPEKPV